MFKAKARLEKWGKEEDSGKGSRGRHIIEEAGEIPERRRMSRPFWNTGKNAIDPSLQIRGFSLSGLSLLHRHFCSGPCLFPFVCLYFCLWALFSILIIRCQERSTTSLTALGEESAKCELSELLMVQSAPIPRPGEPLHCLVCGNIWPSWKSHTVEILYLKPSTVAFWSLAEYLRSVCVLQSFSCLDATGCTFSSLSVNSWQHLYCFSLVKCHTLYAGTHQELLYCPQGRTKGNLLNLLKTPCHFLCWENKIPLPFSSPRGSDCLPASMKEQKANL